jgi:DNA-binding MarR family transcriptional regulator
MNKRQNTLGFLLARASNTMSVLFNNLLKKEGIDLPLSQYVVLKNLYDEDSISQQELAGRVFKDTAAVKRTLDILEKKGLISRIPVNMRENSIVITPSGKELMPKVIDSLAVSKQIALLGISSEEYSVLTDLLERIYHNMK